MAPGGPGMSVASIGRGLRPYHWPRIGGCVLLVAYGMVAAPGVAAQQQPVVPLAQDGGALRDESAATRAMFSAVWGDRAGTRWVEEHNNALAVNRPAHVMHIGYLSDTLSAQYTAPATSTAGGGA